MIPNSPLLRLEGDISQPLGGGFCALDEKRKRTGQEVITDGEPEPGREEEGTGGGWERAGPGDP